MSAASTEFNMSSKDKTGRMKRAATSDLQVRPRVREVTGHVSSTTLRERDVLKASQLRSWKPGLRRTKSKSN